MIKQRHTHKIYVTYSKIICWQKAEPGFEFSPFDSYLTLPFLVGWASKNPSLAGVTLTTIIGTIVQMSEEDEGWS